MAATSPLAPERFPELPPIAGVRLAAYAAGIRYTGRNDLMLAELAPGSTIAGVFTRSLTAGPPVVWCRACLPGGRVRAIVVNSGNANVFTGRTGQEAVEATAAAAAKLFGCEPKEVFISSTGVIGEPPPAQKIVDALPKIAPTPRRRGLGAGGARDHDHRHLPQGRDRDRDDRRHRGAAQRLRQGLGHDRARHGDDARLCLHRRRVAGRGAAAAACRRRPCARSTRSPSTATPRPATPCCSARRSRRATRRSPARPTAGSASSAAPSTGS